MSDSKLQRAIDLGRAQGKLALYFGALGRPGHYLHRSDGFNLWNRDKRGLSLPWSDALMDTGLLKNGKRADICDGKVFWTCGGLSFWYAFYWWDRSGDGRANSNSGFYVRGFGWPEQEEAFAYACLIWPRVVSRQRHPLVLQEHPRRIAVEVEASRP